MRRWRQAMADALYGPGGFFTAAPGGPAEHFRTSVHASPQFAAAILALLRRVDGALDHPPVLDLVDVGAGRGELLTVVRHLCPPELSGRLRTTAVELAPRPSGLDPRVEWRRSV